MIHDLSRVLCAQLTHRRMIDPMSMGHRVLPFWIERVEPSAASAPIGLAQGHTEEASVCRETSK